MLKVNAPKNGVDIGLDLSQLYDGMIMLETTAWRAIQVEAMAFVEDCSFPIKSAYVFEGALYRRKLCNGNHTITITASDETGDKTEKVVPVV